MRRQIRHQAAMVVVVLLASCGGGSPTPENGAPGTPSPAENTPAAATGIFTDIAVDAGIRFTYDNGMTGQYYFPEMLPAGVALFDMDNDGDLDVLFTQGYPIPRPEAGAGAATPPDAARARLFRNDLAAGPDGSRTLRFVDVTDQSRLDARGYGMGVAAADIDNNGCVDLYLTFVGPNQLWRNNCDGTFTDVSKASGTDHAGWGVSASFFDYDRDGWLDLYVGNYVRWDIPSDKRCTGLTGRRDYCTPAVYQPEGDRLFHNRNGRFTDVTARALKGGPHGPALGVSTADFDGDGWLDVYVANDGRPNVLWINRRDGTFENTALLSGAALAADGRPKGSMGVDAGDFDNDGDEDLFTTQLPTEGNNLYVNDGRGLFEDRSAPAGLGPQSRGFTGFGAAWFDFDNDGWLDLFVANGAIEAVRERLADPFPYGERKLLFRNRGDGGFDNVSDEAGPAFAEYEVSRGAAFGDLDNDGDTDIVVANIHRPARVLINRSPPAHWLGLRLTGTARDREMVGARVELTRPDGSRLVRRARSDGSYASANDPRVLFGLGTQTGPVHVRVRWPDGSAEEWRDVAIDTWTTLRQGQGSRR